MSQEIRAQLIDAGKRLDRRGWLPGGGGNFSARLSDDRFLLTASGRHKGHLREEDFLTVNANGEALEPAKRPSAETLLHCERLNALPEVGCVLHGHSAAVTTLSRMWQDDAIVLHDFEMLKGLGGISSHQESVHIPVFENDQDIARLAAVVSDRHARSPIHHGYLIRGHGSYVWGHDVESAICHFESLEFLLECTLMEKKFG